MAKLFRMDGASPDQRTVWREMATLLGGELVEGRRPTADRIVVRHGPWRLEDTGEVVARTTGILRDLGRLAGLIRAVAETLDALHRVGEARDEEVPWI